MAWTAPKTWVVGATGTAAEMNTNVRDNLTFLKTQVASSPQLVNSSGTVTAGTSEADIPGMTLTANYTGVYIVTATIRSVIATADVTINFNIYLNVAGSNENEYITFNLNTTLTALSVRTFSFTWLLTVTASDVIKLRVKSDTASTSTFGGAGGSSWLAASYLGGS